jgi:hypothetical protein
MKITLILLLCFTSLQAFSQSNNCKVITYAKEVGNPLRWERNISWYHVESNESCRLKANASLGITYESTVYDQFPGDPIPRPRIVYFKIVRVKHLFKGESR